MTTEPRSETLETRLGSIELARRGTGRPVLVVHGTPGGSDSSIATHGFLIDAGFEVIAPSRPGYLGTPVESGKSIDAQADLLAAMLDALAIDSLGVVTWSGGGASSYRLAVRHSQRVSALVAVAAVSKAWDEEQSLEDRLVLTTRFGNWLTRFMATHAKKEMIDQTLQAEGTLSKHELKQQVASVLQDQKQVDAVLAMANVAGDYAHRRSGVENDLENFGEIEDLELERISAPVLAIHGNADAELSLDYSEDAVAAIPRSDLMVVDGGTHFCLFAGPQLRTVQERVVTALQAA